MARSLTYVLECVHSNIIEAKVNDILREWRDMWPGGLSESEYSTLNLMAHCRSGSLGYNRSTCGGCGAERWYGSSCGDRHCPGCLGPRQAKWSEGVCERLPDCPHFHVVFTLPEGLNEFFEDNYEHATTILFGAAAETLRTFQRNNWGAEGGFFGVLHTWGGQLNWHPHLHMLVSGGGASVKGGDWVAARPDYLFPVRNMSKVFRAIVLRELEALDADPMVRWGERCGTLEERRTWRVGLARENFNIYSRPTLGNTRAVVRYLARYTSRIAIGNSRIVEVDEAEREVSFRYTDHRDGGRTKERKMAGATFIRALARHIVPKGLRRIRYFGLLAGKKGRFKEIPGAPPRAISEDVLETPEPACEKCESTLWEHLRLRLPAGGLKELVATHSAVRVTHSVPATRRFSLVPP